uniref:Sphingomyelin phosphodiesterase acid like 3B n=1 Tax=Sinocyclocheilus grahami TaxID=75366 RepID=A0A672MYP1_SINGR
GGYFWHISGLHWDPSYDVGSNSASKCASSGGRPTPNAGRFGDYSCDSPWTLINSTLSAMRGILPDPDFIIWTGDITPHVPDEQLGVEPKLLYQTGFRVVVLNTNLYYDQNKLTENIKDPADQFSWPLFCLTQVYIIGHVPPGFFEKKRDKAWFRKEFNKRYIDLIQKYSAVIQGQFFGHHHTDSFRMFYSSKGIFNSATNSVTCCPWFTRFYSCCFVFLKDIITYYMNLTYSNVVHERWEKAYRLTEAFRVPDASPTSMHRVMERISSDKCYLQKYYEFNSVNYDLTECHADCRVDHVCAMREVDFEAYEKCVVKEGGSFNAPVLFTLLLSLMLSLLCLN